MAKRKNNTAASTATAQRGYTFEDNLIGKPIDASSIKVRARAVNQKYATLINSVMGLKVGQALAITVPSDSTMKKFRPNISSMLNRRLKDEIKGKLSFTESQDGKLVVLMTKGE